MGSLSFGRRERFRFQQLGSLKQWSPPVVPGVYAITYKQSADRPKAHTVLCFGEVEDMAKQAETIRTEVEKWWSARGGDAGELFVFLHPMPGSTRFQRANVQSQLVAEYAPHGND